MSDNVYSVTHVVGTSSESIEDAVQRAIGRASSTLRNLDWFEIAEIRGHIEDGRVGHYQVTMQLGFRLDE
jgi:hypothetical protein